MVCNPEWKSPNILVASMDYDWEFSCFMPVKYWMELPKLPSEDDSYYDDSYDNNYDKDKISYEEAVDVLIKSGILNEDETVANVYESIICKEY